MESINHPTVVIIGGVAAGATAAARARRIDEQARIILLESGDYISFANCGLPYYLGREIENRSDLILQTPQDFSARYAIEVHARTEAISIDTAGRTVTARRSHPTLQVSEQVVFPYDRLILAQGGRPVRPPLPGIDLPHVFPLWTIPEMDALDQAVGAPETRTAAVLGGGFIGLETAEALRRRGLDVSVVEMAPHVMALLDDEIAAAVEHELGRNGVRVFTGRRAEVITPDAVILDDGTTVPANLVVLSVGVAPTVSLARDAGLAVGASGGIVVDEFLQTSVPGVFAAGDMIEVTHRVSGTVQRLPLAGPANRQGRIAGTNAVSAPSDYQRYRGVVGTSVIKVFSVEAGSTGLSEAQARQSGIDAQSVTIHKLNHAGYYPGARDLTVKLTYEIPTGRLLGAQAVGAGVDKRIDVIATALAGGLTVDDIAELDLSYAPPFSSANDPVNIAGFVAQNRLTDRSRGITADELDTTFHADETVILDVRTREEYEAGHVAGAVHIELDSLRERIAELDPDRPTLVHCAAGYRAHLATRILVQHGFADTMNILGGFTSIERQADIRPYSQLDLDIAEPTGASASVCASPQCGSPVATEGVAADSPGAATAPDAAAEPESGTAALVIDVRSPGEYRDGHVPGAINIPVNEVLQRHTELPAGETPIVVYCASGSRSEYARLILSQLGHTAVRNGGSYGEMMRNYRKNVDNRD